MKLETRLIIARVIQSWSILLSLGCMLQMGLGHYGPAQIERPIMSGLGAAAIIGVMLSSIKMGCYSAEKRLRDLEARQSTPDVDGGAWGDLGGAQGGTVRER